MFDAKEEREVEKRKNIAECVLSLILYDTLSMHTLSRMIGNGACLSCDFDFLFIVNKKFKSHCSPFQY